MFLPFPNEGFGFGPIQSCDDLSVLHLWKIPISCEVFCWEIFAQSCRFHWMISFAGFLGSTGLVILGLHALAYHGWRFRCVLGQSCEFQSGCLFVGLWDQRSIETDTSI